MKNFIKLWVSSAVITLFSWTSLSAQTQIVQDYSQILEIPNIKAMQASTSHLYVLSELEGMAVFRAYGDSLQWLLFDMLSANPSSSIFSADLVSISLPLSSLTPTDRGS